ncbi:MAG: pilus (MSHA type) biogenesis protein MshL [Gammaproteobacteria bacterium]|nr:pilus (MSHA type) biogenesis protein MshL [Gammaproteobacteria bacterium]
MSTIRYRKTFLLISMGLLASCQMTPVQQERATIQQSLDMPAKKSAQADSAFKVPTAITQALMPSTINRSIPKPKYNQKRFDIAANDVSIQQFFANLVDKTPYSVAFHPDLSGHVSLQLKQVTMTEVIDAVGDLYGYQIKKQGRILQVLPAAITTESFNFNYLLVKRNGVSKTSITSGGITSNSTGGNNSNNDNSSGNGNNNSGSSASSAVGTNGTFIESRTETDFWQELEQTLSQLITGEGRYVSISPQAGIVTVRGFPSEINTVRKYLKQSEQNIQRQVILEARIIEVTLSDGYQQGIEWSKILATTGNNNITTLNYATSKGRVSDVISSTLGGVASLTFSNMNFAGVVNLLKTQGDVNVLSSPRITALNNQKAVIKVGTDEYFVTGISSTSSSVGDNVVSNPTVELTPFFSGIALDVTPQIDENGQVLLHVHPSVINVKEQQKIIELQSGTYVLPLANSSIRETDTIIRAASGDVVVLGGLMSSRTSDDESKVPLLGDIPLLGQLFTNRKETIQKTELIILIRPIVVEQGTWENELQRSKDLIETWYPDEEH